MKTVDGRKLACPKPVLLTKDAISDDATNQVEVIVDNKAALTNVKRFLTSFGFEVEKVTTHTINNNSEFSIIANRVKSKQAEKESEFDVNDYPCPVPQTATKGKNVFIKSEFLGIGDDKLGALLMKAFIYTLNKVDNKPQGLLFMNSGVKLCIEGAITIENLQELEKSGVEILVCGTCLDFFGISDKLQVGIISNMYDIAEKLTDSTNVLSI